MITLTVPARTVPTTTETYRKFEELEESEKESLSNIEAGYIESDELADEYYQTLLERIGFYNIKNYWSLGYCQSDGFAFDADLSVDEFIEFMLGKTVDPDRELELLYKALPTISKGLRNFIDWISYFSHSHELTGNINATGMRSNHQTANIEGYFSLPDSFDSYINEFDSLFSEFVGDIADTQFINIRNQYEYLISHEQLAEKYSEQYFNDELESFYPSELGLLAPGY